MNITNTILTKTAEEKTANARYVIEYVIVNGALTRIQATVQSLSDDMHETLGYISLENDNIVCNLTARKGLSTLLADFERFVGDIRANVALTGIEQETTKQ